MKAIDDSCAITRDPKQPSDWIKKYKNIIATQAGKPINNKQYEAGKSK